MVMLGKILYWGALVAIGILMSVAIGGTIYLGDDSAAGVHWIFHEAPDCVVVSILLLAVAKIGEEIIIRAE